MGKNKKILKELRKLNRTQSRIEKLLIAEARESNEVKHYHINASINSINSLIEEELAEKIKESLKDQKENELEKEKRIRKNFDRVIKEYTVAINDLQELEREKKEKKYGKYEYSESELKADWNKK